MHIKFTIPAVSFKRLQIVAAVMLAIISGLFSLLATPTVSAAPNDTSDGCPIGYMRGFTPLEDKNACYRGGIDPNSPGGVSILCYPPEVVDRIQCKLPLGTPSAIPGAASCQPPYAYNQQENKCTAPPNASGGCDNGGTLVRTEPAAGGRLRCELAPTTNPSPVPPPAAGGGNPRCAVVNYGPLPCPTVGSGIDPASNGCYVRNPDAANPADRSRFLPAGCDDQAFTPPAAIVCNANTPADVRAANCDPATACTGDQCNLTVKYINPIIRALAALVGVGVTISIIVAGIQYASSANDPQKVAAAKRRIITAILTLIGFFLFYRFLDWIIPGSL